MNLDGETNLKDKEMPINTVKEGNLTDFKGNVECDKPNASIDQWDATLHPPTGGSSLIQRPLALNIKNLLLRGCTLKNTQYVYGVVIYTGMDTKIYKNSKKSTRKVSNLMKTMNKVLYSVFIFQWLIVITFSTLSLFWIKKVQSVHKYLAYQDSSLGFQRWAL